MNHPEPSSVASRISEDFYPKNFDALAEKYPSLDLESVLDEFKAYWLSNTTAKELSMVQNNDRGRQARNDGKYAHPWVDSSPTSPEIG